jgi:hypothetical protein
LKNSRISNPGTWKNIMAIIMATKFPIQYFQRNRIILQITRQVGSVSIFRLDFVAVVVVILRSFNFTREFNCLVVSDQNFFQTRLKQVKKP